MIELNKYLIKSTDYLHVSQDTTNEFEDVILRSNNWKISPRIKCCKSKYYKIIKNINFRLNIKKKKGVYFAVLMGINCINKTLPFFYDDNYIKVIYLFDAWESDFQKIADMIEKFKIDIVLFSAKMSFNHFIDNFNKLSKYYWIPEAINIREYCFYQYKEKNIDIIEFGRKYDDYHNKISKVLIANNVNFIYEKIKGDVIFSDRKSFIKGLASSKISICFPSSITHPERSGNISTMTIRYLQSMASKCLIVGEMPYDMLQLFDYMPIVKYDRGDPGKQLLKLLNDYETYIPLIEKNYEFIRQNHCWENRLKNISNVLNNL